MHPHVLRRDRVVLVLVDFQEKLHPRVARKDAVASGAVKLAEAARVLGLPVLVTEHAVDVLGPTIEPLRTALGGFEPLRKTVFSCFGSAEIGARLESLGRPQVLLAGEETHVCVSQTAHEAISRGYAVHLAEDACGSRSAENHAIGVRKMSLAGAVPASVESAIFELLERAGTDEFRKLLPVIKRT
jgi:nicotinamidase-related amidase